MTESLLLTYDKPTSKIEAKTLKDFESPEKLFGLTEGKQKNRVSFIRNLPKLGEIQDKIDETKDESGILSQEEIRALVGDLEKQKQLLATNIKETLDGSDGLTKEEIEQIIQIKELLGKVWEITNDIIIPEWYEVPLLILPISQEVIASEKITKIALILEKALPILEKMIKGSGFLNRAVNF